MVEEAAAGKELIVDIHLKAGENLKGLAKSVDGIGFAFTHLELPGKDVPEGEEDEKFGVVDSLEAYTHLRYVNLSNHKIIDPGPLIKMRHLLSVNLSKNSLTTEGLEKFREAPLMFLQVLDLSHNRLEEYSLDFPMLRELYLNNNQLNTVKLNTEVGGSVLKLLNLQDNEPTEPPPEPAEGEEPPPPKGLQDCNGFGVPSLETLLLTGNPIKSLNGLQTLTGVTELDFTKNPVDSLDGLPTEGKLSKLIMMDCKIAAWEEMDKLAALTTLTQLNVIRTALLEEGQRGRIVMRVPGLKMLNELPITDEDKEAAKLGDPAPPAAEE